MSTVQVWHWMPKHDEATGIGFHGIDAQRAARIMRGDDPDLYFQFVARIESEERDAMRRIADAWDCTNSVETPWFTPSNSGASPQARRGCRSSSVGDLLIDDATGRRYVTAMIGFDKVEV